MILRIEEGNKDLIIDRLDGGGMPVYQYKGKPFTGFLFKNNNDGSLCFEREYKKGYEDGWYRSYYKNGQKKKEYKSLNNMTVDDTYKEWDEEGNLTESF